MRRGVDAGCDDYGALGEAVLQVIVSFACGRGLVGGGEESAFHIERDFPSGAPLFIERSDGGFEVAEAGADLFAGEFDARGEAHMGFVEVDLLVGDFDHLVFGHAGGENGAELLVIQERKRST